MKLDLFAWQEIEPGKRYETAKGSLNIKASQEVAVYASAEGIEVLIGVGTHVRADFAYGVEYWVEGKPKTRVFTHAPGKLWHKPVGEVYTNADRMPDESGSVAEVRRAMREFKLEQRELRRAMREERRNLRATQNPDPTPSEETAEEVDPPGDPSTAENAEDTTEASNQD